MALRLSEGLGLTALPRATIELLAESAEPTLHIVFGRFPKALVVDFVDPGLRSTPYLL